jgi:hypothetical protein
MGNGQRRLFLRVHGLIPASQVLQIGQSGLAVEQVVPKHAVQIVIHEQRAVGQKKRRSRQHVVDWLQEFRKLRAQVPSVAGPSLDTSSSELPFFMANEHRPFDEGTGRNHVRIVHFESHRLHLALNVARQDKLNPFELFGKQVESQAPIYVPRHLLPEIRQVADPALPVDQAGHRMPLTLRRFDDRSPIMVGDVVESERNTMARQDVSDCDTERGPRKLNQGDHGTYMKEANRNRKIVRGYL